MRRVAIVGGGIGGLTAAIALRRIGCEAAVYEQAPEIKEVGAGLGLLANAVRVLDYLGVGQAVRRHGQPLRTGRFCTASGRILQSLDFAKYLGNAVPSMVVHRADLLRWLAEALPGEVLHTGHACTGVSEEKGCVRLAFAHGTTAEADIVVGADGLKSVVRQHLWGSFPLRYSGQTCYRGVAAYSLREAGVMPEVQGAGQRASVVAIGPGRVYWWAAFNAPQGERDDPAKRRDVLLGRYRGWPFEIPEAIAATPPDAILRNDLVDIAPLSRWSRGRITLLGDAAHPMTPNLGQGACSAIEDALVLARHVKHAADPERALLGYEKERLPRASMLVRDSWQYGAAARWTHPLLVAARDNLTALMPPAWLAQRFRRYLAFDTGPL